MIRRIIAASAVAAAVLGLAGPVDAAKPRRTELTLSYLADAGYATAVTLRCQPVGGAHPKAAKACNALKKVGGQPDRLTPARTMCMMIYAPVTAKIAGTWQSAPVQWSRKYGNTCELSRATGVIFAF
jgi:hypothetical protein